MREERRLRELNRTVFQVASTMEKVLANEDRHRHIRNVMINSIHQINRAVGTAVNTLEDNVESDKDREAMILYILDKLKAYTDAVISIYGGGNE